MIFSTQKGFTLLEAIVALVILSTSGMTIYAWLGTSLDSFRRVNDTVELNQLSKDLDAYFRSLQLKTESSQTIQLNGYQIEWQASLVEPKKDGIHPSGAMNAFELGLYNLEVNIFRNNYQVGTYYTRVVGHELKVPDEE